MKRWIIVSSIAVVALAIVYALYAWFHSPMSAPAEVTAVVEIPEVSITEDSYEDGIRLIEGTVRASTPCQTMEATGVHNESGGVRVDIILPPDDGICLERPEEREFSVEVEADEDSLLTVFVNGVEATVLHD